MDPRGRYVVLAGPDGCGKSTLVQQLRQAGLSFEHRHWRPGAIPSLRRLRGLPEVGVVTDPHGRAADPLPKALVRTVYYWFDFLLGYFTVVRPALRAGRHFVVERGWSDMCIDPVRYGLRDDRAVRLLARVLPPSDVTLVLAVPPEVGRQFEAWTADVPATRAVLVVDANRPPDVVAEDVRRRLDGLG
jgi:energy-coupling factor transporter ATP-binding protein EcfA2